ncbi:PilN domain-containing protein [Kangiella sp. HZ709]|uniref:PilN domain-containing protein n=1 Tax=Kangiella sp. HZ709 TaxID=2666328 RepID=UPI0012AF131B|nr:PilN domain-containing protein [Kangiella sp. HZ709]MRX27647.1 fimbrial assembly protein [Kangiella sp. HZ709]
MALINLLDWREEARQQRQKEFFITLGLMVLFAVGIMALVYWAMQGRIGAQQERNNYLTQEIDQLNRQITEIVKIEKELAELENQMDVIQGLQQSRPEVVKMFSDLVTSVPEGIHLNSFERTNDKNLTFVGRGETTPRISEFMRKLDSSERLRAGDLKDIKKEQKGIPAQNFVLDGLQVIPGRDGKDADGGAN